jgi:hypothetical protein
VSTTGDPEEPQLGQCSTGTKIQVETPQKNEF